MPMDVTLRVTGVDLDDTETQEVLSNFPDIVWEEIGDVTRATIFVEAESAVADTVDVARKLTAIPGLRVLGVDRDFVATSDIAVRANVSREAARKWTAHADFPQASGQVGGDGCKIWPWNEVAAWLQEHRGINFDEALPSTALITQIDNCLMRNPDSTSVTWHQVGTSTEPRASTQQRAPVLSSRFKTVAVGGDSQAAETLGVGSSQVAAHA